MTYRQLLTDVGLAVLLAAPTLALAKPHAELPATPTIAEENASPAPVAELAERAAETRV